VLDLYEDHGGNLIDTAATYAAGRNEEILGRLLAGNRRDRFVLSTMFAVRRNPEDVNAAGASRRNLRRSLDESLRWLRTDHIELLWLHAWYQGGRTKYHTNSVEARHALAADSFTGILWHADYLLGPCIAHVAQATSQEVSTTRVAYSAGEVS
jgi:aryl-alcohol dehydrogenase-like predicted oxidoreductase